MTMVAVTQKKQAPEKRKNAPKIVKKDEEDADLRLPPNQIDFQIHVFHKEAQIEMERERNLKSIKKAT